METFKRRNLQPDKRIAYSSGRRLNVYERDANLKIAFVQPMRCDAMAASGRHIYFP